MIREYWILEIKKPCLCDKALCVVPRAGIEPALTLLSTGF